MINTYRLGKSTEALYEVPFEEFSKVLAALLKWNCICN